MIDRKDIKKLLETYGTDIHIGTLGGHSALDVCRGAKDEGLKTVVIARKGREQTYTKYYKAIVDEVIVVDDFKELTSDTVQEKLRSLNTVFINSRYFWVYCDMHAVENDFSVPIFGHRALVRAEERDEDKNQYFLLEQAGIATPKRFKKPQDIDRLVVVKAAEAARGYERAFFLVSSYEEYGAKSKELLEAGTITQESLDKATIEEFALGAQINFNFFYSPLTDSIELLGTDIRRQTNLDGVLRLPAPEQMEVLKKASVKYVETGHVAVTVKESLLEKAFAAAESFLAAAKKHYAPGLMGPFGLQGAIVAREGSEEFVVFDVSMRIPGSPGSKYTPYQYYLHGEDLSVGRRIAREIKHALADGKLGDIVT